MIQNIPDRMKLLDWIRFALDLSTMCHKLYMSLNMIKTNFN